MEQKEIKQRATPQERLQQNDKRQKCPRQGEREQSWREQIALLYRAHHTVAWGPHCVHGTLHCCLWCSHTAVCGYCIAVCGVLCV